MGYRTARRVVIGVVGATVLLVGLALLFLPGPAFVVIPIGLAILSLEFAWARRWLRRAREHAASLASSVARSPTSNPHRDSAQRRPTWTSD